MSASPSPLKNAVDYFDVALTKLARKIQLPNLVLSPFFWLTIPPLQTSEGSQVFLEKYSGVEPTSRLQMFFRMLSKNGKDILSVTSFFGKKEGKLFFGTTNPSAQIYIQTWLYKDDFEKFLADKKERYWGDLNITLPSKLKVQYLLLPLFDISEKQVAELVEDGSVVMNPSYQIGFSRLCASALSSLQTFVFSRGAFTSAQHRLLYWVSNLNYRYLRAQDVLKVFAKEMQLNANALVLMPWEGQPEQKALCHLFRQKGCRVWGYIHSSATNNPSYLAKFLHPALVSYFPEKLLVHGSDLDSTLKSVNWNSNEIELIHCLRFKPRKKSDFEGKLFLPIDIKTSKETIKIARDLVAKGTLQITSIASHPANKTNKELNDAMNGFPYAETSNQVIVGGFSAVIFESLEIGCEVINITPGGVGEMDGEAYRSIQRSKICDFVYRFTLPKESLGSLINFNGLGVPAHELISSVLTARL